MYIHSGSFSSHGEDWMFTYSVHIHFTHVIITMSNRVIFTIYVWRLVMRVLLGWVLVSRQSPSAVFLRFYFLHRLGFFCRLLGYCCFLNSLMFSDWFHINTEQSVHLQWNGRFPFGSGWSVSLIQGFSQDQVTVVMFWMILYLIVFLPAQQDLHNIRPCVCLLDLPQP